MTVSTRRIRRPASLFTVLALISLANVSAGAETAETTTDEDKGSHEHIETIDLLEGRKGTTVHSFCLDRAGNILVACSGSGEVVTIPPGAVRTTQTKPLGQIRVISPNGKCLATWGVQTIPRAINTGPDGSIYCGGSGRLTKLDPTGKTLRVADAPQIAYLALQSPAPAATAPSEPPEKVIGDKEARIAELRKEIATMRGQMREAIARTMKERKSKDDDFSLPESYREQVRDYGELRKELRSLTISPERLAKERERAMAYTRRIHAIAATERDVFTVCPASKGYGFDVWRTDTDFASPQKIVTGLRGCCGQMDIQTANGKLYVAENARKRVVCYDREGVKLAAWGKAHRTDVKGFGSCCNPMNIQFGPNREVYTVEAGLGRIKRYTPDGKFLGLVGKVKDVPSCMHNPIAITADGARVFLLDPRKAKALILTRTADPKL